MPPSTRDSTTIRRRRDSVVAGRSPAPATAAMESMADRAPSHPRSPRLDARWVLEVVVEIASPPGPSRCLPSVLPRPRRARRRRASASRWAGETMERSRPPRPRLYGGSRPLHRSPHRRGYAERGVEEWLRRVDPAARMLLGPAPARSRAACLPSGCSSTASWTSWGRPSSVHSWRSSDGRRGCASRAGAADWAVLLHTRSRSSRVTRSA